MTQRYLVHVAATSKIALAKLQQYDFDLFPHTARQKSKDEFTIDGLLTANQAEQLVRDGYKVLMQRDVAADAEDTNQVIELPEWLAERGF